MQFFLLLMFNIFMGAVIYLVISLKLEKSVDDYRKNKFREEMDAIITEFNSTAERNISLLENRIEIIKKIIEKTGDMTSVDIVIEDEKKEQKVNNEEKKDLNTELSKERNEIIRETSTAKKSLLLLKKKVIDKFEQIANTDDKKENIKDTFSETNLKFEGSRELPAVSGNTIDFTIEKDLTEELQTLRKNSYSAEDEYTQTDEPDAQADENSLEEETVNQVSRDDLINGIIEEHGDTYTRVAELNKLGCSSEEIANHAQIPVGEVHLVLNLIQS